MKQFRPVSPAPESKEEIKCSSPTWIEQADEWERQKKEKIERSGWTPTPEQIKEYEERKKCQEEEEWTIYPRYATMEDVADEEKEEYFKTRLKTYLRDQEKRRKKSKQRKTKKRRAAKQQM